MKELKASTKAGQAILTMGQSCCWTSLHNLYEKWSEAKQKAFDWCYNEFINSQDAEAFGVGNANKYGFTASWLCIVNGKMAMRVETRSNSYIVYLDE